MTVKPLKKEELSLLKLLVEPELLDLDSNLLTNLFLLISMFPNLLGETTTPSLKLPDLNMSIILIMNLKPEDSTSKE